MKPETVISISVQRMVCTGCGAEANAPCNCGMTCVPKLLRAVEAVAASPNKSNRAIAESIGLAEATVRRARGASSDAPAVREGRDGRPYAIRQRPAPKPQDLEMPTAEEAEESWQETVYDQACLLLERMADETRQKFFAHIRKKYHD